MTDIAVVGFTHAPHVRETTGTTNGVEMLVPCFHDLYERLGITKSDIGFWCSGSSDYLAGRAFSFISAIDAIGAVPPINESHVEMDAAWALYEAWVKLITGEVDTALVYGFGKSSAGNLPTSPGAFQPTGSAGDLYVAVYDTTKTGTASFLYGTYLGGGGTEACDAIAVDAQGRAFLSGNTQSTTGSRRGSCRRSSAPAGRATSRSSASS